MKRTTLKADSLAWLRSGGYDRAAVLKIVGTYFLLGVLWIYSSDEILARLAPNEDVQTAVSVYKGIGFIVLTSVLLFFLIRAYLKELHEKVAAIEELSVLRSKFITIISHQLRTPITSINWNLEMLLNGDYGVLEEAQRTFLRATYNESIRLTWRIHELLTAMDIEEGRILIERADFLLEGICKSVFSEYEERARLKNIAFTYASSIDGGSSMLEGDGEKIRTVVRELIENAIVYTAPGGSVSTRLSLSGSRIRFTVTDTGVGIPAGEQKRIFNRFFRASNAGVMQPDSSGIGLYVAKYFVEQHKGVIGFTSDDGKGSMFWFEIPVAQKDQ